MNTETGTQDQIYDVLSETLRDVLPEKAQEIYVKAYQRSWENYKEGKGGEMGREGVAHRDAMNAVQKYYYLDTEKGKWYEIDDTTSESDTEQEIGFIETTKKRFIDTWDQITDKMKIDQV